MRISEWPPRRLTLLESALDQLADAVKNGENRDVNEQIWLTRFLVVRACGYLEQVVHETVVAHVQASSFGTVKSFAMSWLDKSKNPSVENMIKVTGRLDHAIQMELQELLDANDKRLHEKISLLVGRRHQIAHGENEGLNSRSALELTAISKELADWFILRLKPDRPAAKTR